MLYADDVVLSLNLVKYVKVMIRPAEIMSSPGKIKAILKCVFNYQTYGALLALCL